MEFNTIKNTSIFFYMYWQQTFEVKIYKVVQIWPGQFVCKQDTVCPGHIWTTLYFDFS
jgi:hypothetical protein